MKRILIAGNYKKKAVQSQYTYLRAVRDVGAVAAVAYAADQADAKALEQAFDALLLPGGGDLPASDFGQQPHPANTYDDPIRDLSDRLLTEAFQSAGKRILGICRGCQVANVFRGGTLYQHLPDAFDPVLWHSGNITGRHPVTIAPNTLLSSLFGSGSILVNSSHHQAVQLPGAGLIVTAKAPDGVVEALEGENILLLQWHPERMTDTMRPVFEWLVG